MCMPKKANALYAQSGGVTSVINVSCYGLFAAWKNNLDYIPKLFAAKNGIVGVLQEDLIDLGEQNLEHFDKILHTPGGVFGSCRFKLQGSITGSLNIDKDPEKQSNDLSTINNADFYQCKRIIDVFKHYNIGYFFYNGGNDSADTCLKIAEIANHLHYPLQAIHIPKTIDNDLVETNNCPGFGSVAKYIAISISEIILDLQAMSSNSTKVFVLEVMGRNTGWIASSAGLLNNPAIIILLPEVTFEHEKFLAQVSNIVKNYGYCLIVASEGIKGRDNRYLSESSHIDSFGHKQLGGVGVILSSMINEKLRLKARYAVPDYMQRSARHITSSVDVEHSFMVGNAAVNYALNGQHNTMIAIVKHNNALDNMTTWTTACVPLIKVANYEKYIPNEYISLDGFGVTDSCIQYLSPLIKGENYPNFLDGLPDYYNANFKLVNKQLPNWVC